MDGYCQEFIVLMGIGTGSIYYRYSLSFCAPTLEASAQALKNLLPVDRNDDSRLIGPLQDDKVAVDGSCRFITVSDQSFDGSRIGNIYHKFSLSFCKEPIAFLHNGISP